jgi:DNA-binding MarR family transcriptional regulator
MPNRTISERHATLGSLLRKPYEKLQDAVYSRLASKGFGDIRPAHSSVFRYILPAGSRVSDLADKASMTKQSMAYLTQSLTDLGYAAISPDPDDGRAKLVHLTERGEQVWQMLVELSAEVEADIARITGSKRLEELRDGLVELADAVEKISGTAQR